MKRALVIDSDTEDEAYRDIAAEAVAESEAQDQPSDEMEDEAYRKVATAAAAESESEPVAAATAESEPVAAESEPEEIIKDETDPPMSLANEKYNEIKNELKIKRTLPIEEGKEATTQRDIRDQKRIEETILERMYEIVRNITTINNLANTTTDANKFQEYEKQLWHTILPIFTYQNILNNFAEKYFTTVVDPTLGTTWTTFIKEQFKPIDERLRNLADLHREHPDYPADYCRHLTSLPGNEIVQEMVKSPHKMGYSDLAAMQKQTETEVPPAWVSAGMNEQIISEIAKAANERIQSNPIEGIEGFERGLYSWGNKIPDKVWESDDAKRITLIVPAKVWEPVGLALENQPGTNLEGHTIAIVINQEESGANKPCTITIADPSVLINDNTNNAKTHGVTMSPNDPMMKFRPKHHKNPPATLARINAEPIIPVSEYVDRILSQQEEALKPAERKENYDNFKEYLKRHKAIHYDVKRPPTYNDSDDCSPFALAIGWYLTANDDLIRDQSAFNRLWHEQGRRRLWYQRVPGNTTQNQRPLLWNINPITKLFNGLRNQMMKENPSLITADEIDPKKSAPMRTGSTRIRRAPVRLEEDYESQPKQKRARKQTP